MRYHHFFVLLLTTVLSSCAVHTRVATTRSLEIYGPGVIHNAVIADLDVEGTKVTGTATGHRSDPTMVKNAALADAIQKAGADLLVEPSFVLETNGNKTTATVTGFPATYKNFRNAVAADSTLIRAGHMHRAQTAVAKEAPAKRKGTGLIAGVATAIVIALTIFITSGL